MDAGDIAQGVFEISIGVLGITTSFFVKNDKSKESNFIKKYHRQVLLITGIAMLYFGISVLTK